MKAQGPVERQGASDKPEAERGWQGSPVGTEFFIGDAARTADGGAQLKLVGNAEIAMQPHTVLRFGARGQGAAIGVDVGAIDLSGPEGNYALEIGDVRLGQNGSIRITATGDHESSFELLAGAAQIARQNGEVVALEIGKVVELGIGPIKVTPRAPEDAGIPDAAAEAAPPDAAVALSTDVALEFTGKHLEQQLAGETKWSLVPSDTRAVAKGTKLRLGTGTTAKLTSNGTTLELAGGSRMTVQDNLLFGVENGIARAVVPAATDGTVDVPGGSVALKGGASSPAEAKLDVNGRETKVTVLRGSAKLVGNGGAELAMSRGETASVAKAGQIHPIEAIPSYFDMRVQIGETPNFTVHDPKGATALQFQFNGKCPNGGVIEMDHDSRFRTAKVSAGKEAANVLATGGGWAYRLRCTQGDQEGTAVASGRVVVVRDDGRRPLPKDPPTNTIDPDGRSYRISYQSVIPNVKIKVGAGSAKLHLATGGADETFETTTGTLTVPGTKLKEATYTYWVELDGVKQDKISTLIINFDQTAPQVYIESPQNGVPFNAEIDVRGAVLPGWTAKVDVVEIPVDKNTRRFAAKVPPPAGNALAIRLSHPQRGTHFYLRRGTK